MCNSNSLVASAGYVVILHGAAVARGSKLQPYAALSTTEDEVQACVAAGRVAIWMGYVLPELVQELDAPVPVLGDDQAAYVTRGKKKYPKNYF